MESEYYEENDNMTLCPGCDGYGVTLFTGEPCPLCGGSGLVEEIPWDGEDME